MENKETPFECVSRKWEEQFQWEGEKLREMMKESQNKEKVKHCDMAIAMMKQLIRIGEAKAKLYALLDDEYLQQHHFSKHSVWYDSEHELEADKLDDCRRKFYHIHDQLWDVFGLLTVEDTDDDY